MSDAGWKKKGEKGDKTWEGEKSWSQKRPLKRIDSEKLGKEMKK